MDRRILWVFYVLLPITIASKDYFTAAVFEHRPRAGLSDGTAKEIVSANLEFYVKAAATAATKGADIIVFNEYGLFPYGFEREVLRKFAEHVPDPQKASFNPCVENANDHFILHTLSCMAKNNEIFVVANMVDLQTCDGACDADNIADCAEKCSDDGVLMHNTDVVFNREGTLVARYYKVHPYFEVLNKGEDTEFVTFKTDFGTFGMIVCFDSVFEEAAMLARDHKIDTLLFPTYWFDDIVPLNAVEWQQAWALANRVNFLAANTQTPELGSLGSGIYSKEDGALVYAYDPDGESKLLVANLKLRGSSDVPANPSFTIIRQNETESKIETGEHFPEYCYEKKVGPAIDPFKDYRCFKSQTENYTLVKINKPSGRAEACNNGFCCSVTYSADDIGEDFYLAVLNGTNNVKGYYHWCEETCLLVRCDSFEGKPCAIQPSVSKTIFKTVKMKATFTTRNIYPTVSKNRFRLASTKEWYYKTSGSETTLKFRSESNDPLLKVGLMGRCYDRDPLFVPFYKF